MAYRRAVVSLNARQFELLERLDPLYGESVHAKARQLLVEKLGELMAAPGVIFSAKRGRR